MDDSDVEGRVIANKMKTRRSERRGCCGEKSGLPHQRHAAGKGLGVGLNAEDVHATRQRLPGS